MENTSGEEILVVGTLDRVLSAARDNPFEVMEKWPIAEIWSPIIRDLERRDVLSWHQDYVERLIQRLLKSHDSDWWEKLLSWYVIHSKGEEAVAAAEFAISLLDMSRYGLESDISRIICAKLRRSDSAIYWAVPSRRWLFEKVFERFLDRRSGEYMTYDWAPVQRVIRRIVDERDVSFLDQMTAILVKLQDELIPYEVKHEPNPFIQGEHTHFLQTACNILRDEQANQFPDLAAVFGSLIREQAGLLGSVVVRIHFPGTIAMEVPGQLEVRLETEPTKAEETGNLLEALKNYYVRCYAAGFWDEKERYSNWDLYSASIEGVFEGLSCSIALPVTTKGAKRFRLALHQRGPGEELGRTYGYITVE